MRGRVSLCSAQSSSHGSQSKQSFCPENPFIDQWFNLKQEDPFCKWWSLVTGFFGNCVKFDFSFSPPVRVPSKRISTSRGSEQFGSFINFFSNSDRYWTNSPTAPSALPTQYWLWMYSYLLFHLSVFFFPSIFTI